MIYVFDEFELDPDKLELRRTGKPVKADALSLRLLAALLREAGQLVSKRELIERVWDDRAVSDNVITVAMVRLRKALGHRPGEHELIVNVHGRGYRFVRPVTLRDGALEPVLSERAAVAVGPRFVGRKSELGQLREALAAAQLGRGSVSILRGEAGIGKTRVVEQLAHEAEAAGLLVAWGYCHESGDTPPLWPFIQLARDLVGGLATPGQPAHQPELRQLLTLLPELAGAPDSAQQPPQTNRPDSSLAIDGAAKYRVFDAFTRLFSHAANARPCLLILDDLHRADAASLELLRFWIDQAARARVLLVGTVRTPDLSSRGQDARMQHLLAHRQCHVLALERLSEAAVTDYVSSVLVDRRGELARAVHEKSDGNPFFMVELVRQLRHAEHPAPALLTVPAAARELMQQRVRSLDDASRGLLSCAAVIGRSFDLPLLAGVSGQDLGTVMTALDEALASEVLLSARDSKTTFTFSHELLREVLYDGLPPKQRRAYHLLVAAALEQRQQAAGPVRTPELAYHLHAALPDGDLRKTVSYCDKAADEAADLHAYADAMRYLRHAREALALTADPSPRLQLGLLLREALCARVCSSPRFEPVIRELIGQARRLRAGPLLAHAAMLLAPHPGFPGFPGTGAALEEALTMLSPDDASNESAALARLSTVGPAAYDARTTARLLERILALAQTADTQLAHYNARLAQLYLSNGPTQASEAALALRELDRLAKADPRRLGLVPILVCLHQAIRAGQAGDLASVTEKLERAEETCRHMHSRELLWHVQRLQILARVNRGETSQAFAALRALHAEAEQEHILGSQLLTIHDQVVLFDAAESLPRELLRVSLASAGDDPPSVWSLKLRTLVHAGLHEQARTDLTRISPSQLEHLPHDRDYLGTLAALARTALALGARDYAAALCPLLARQPKEFALHCSFLCEGSTQQLLGLLLSLLGQVERAREHTEQAVLLSERAGYIRCAGLARAERGALEQAAS